MKRLIIAVLLMFTFGCATTSDPGALPPTELERQQSTINSVNLGMLVLRSYVALESDDWSDEKLAKYQFYLDELDIAIAVWQAFVDGGSLADASTQQLIVTSLIEAMEKRQALERAR